MAAPDAQRQVRETMIAAGGYWRPLAAVARLLEELGELSELVEVAGPGLGAELADLWIITTALADQFLARVAEPGSGSEAGADLGMLLAAAGPIARVVNHYDGPKVPRAGEPLPTLHGAIAAFHDTLLAFAASRQIDLATSVRTKIEQIHARGDIERFGRDGFDPSTAPVLAQPLPEGLPGRLWGAPEPASDGTPFGRLAGWPLRMFAKAARAEGLQGILIPGPPSGGEGWLGALVAELDTAGRPERFELAGETLRARPLQSAATPLALVEPA